MTEEEIKIIALVLTAIGVLFSASSFGFNILQYRWNRPRLKFRIGLGIGSQDDVPGTWIGASISISNVGGKSTHFNNIRAVQEDKDFFYPMFSVNGGTAIEPGNSVTGLIPVGHFVGHDIKDIVVSYGVGGEYRVPRKMLTKAMKNIVAEKVRLEALGFPVHRPSAAR